MHLTELIQILAGEAQSSRAELKECAQLLCGLPDGADSEAVLEQQAQTYADFCSRTAMAAQSIGLDGLASVAETIQQGLSMVSGLPLELRDTVGPLLDEWPDFFSDYLQSWSAGAIHKPMVGAFVALMGQAEYLTPLDAEQQAALIEILMSPPLLATQQAELTPEFQPLDDESTSLELPEDADADIVEGFLAEGPRQVEQLMLAVQAVVQARITPAQLELAHRTAHTLKGTAAIAGIKGVATLAHALEDVLEAARQPDFVAPDALKSLMVAVCEQLESALDHLTQRSPVSGEFAHISRSAHAWACYLQGQTVPDAALAYVVDANISFVVQPDTASLADTGEQATRSEEPVAEEEAQIRIPARTLDRMFRAVNELAIGLLRLRLQTEDILQRTEGLSALDRPAQLCLTDLDRQINLDGMGRVDERTAAGRTGLALAEDEKNFDSLELDRYNELTGSMQALKEAMHDQTSGRENLVPSLRSVAALAQRQLDFAREAQFHIGKARLKPLSDLRARLRRTVRQTAAAVGREVRLEITGDDLRVDAAVLGPMSEALLHLLRNSVDHGIEPAPDRLNVGKPAQGLIKLDFQARGTGVLTTLSDDGKGLDYEAILDRAVSNGLVAADANPSQDDIGRLIFLPGFSTRTTVTETSGRGVGLDAVSQALARLQGNVSVTSTPGAGTHFRMFALASIGTIHALHVQTGGEHFLVPSIQLERADPPMSSADALVPSAEPGNVGPETMHLSELLHGIRQKATADELKNRPTLLVRTGQTIRRISVDRILEAREFLVAPPPELLDRMSGISGVATLADGSLGVVLDLVKLASTPLAVQAQGLRKLQASVPDQAHILVADDSVSVRNTLSTLLRDANYRVTTARDGLEAIGLMTGQRFSLVLTDLEMPQLNGFELTEFIRQRSGQPELPVVMLTSRGQEKHRTRATQAGVDSFLLKPYSDQQLLEVIRSLSSSRPTQSKTASRSTPFPANLQEKTS